MIANHSAESAHPGFDEQKYQVRTWKNLLLLHWILNPAIAINELALGQRLPGKSLIEKGGRKPLAERTYIPCPHCHTIHSSLKWSPQNNTEFKNWFGLYCDNCQRIIPCVRNLTSLLILALTIPFWYRFKEGKKQQWLQVQRIKFSKPLALTPPDYPWWYIGLRYTFFMFPFMTIFNALILGENYSWPKLLLNALVWTIAGLVFGLISKRSEMQQMAKANKKTLHQPS